MNRLPLALMILGTLLMAACTEDDDIITTNLDDTGNADDLTDVVIDDDDQDVLRTVLNLPNSLYNYANPNLPAHFRDNDVTRDDNTPNDNPVTNEGATLGRVLFYDKELSLNRTIACASCHLQSAAFSDPDQFSTGFEGGLTGRNSMGLSNARYYRNGRFFWDERAETLEDQVLMPIQDHIEMGLTLNELVNRIDAADYYDPLFTMAFGDANVTSDRISLALAQFVRSMVSYESRFDQGIAAGGNPNGGGGGNNNNFPGFTAQEDLGRRLFFSGRTQCDNCHNEVTMVAPNARNNGLDMVYADNGVGAATGDADRNGDFKVPSLRNIELTGPYMHDGRFETLDQVIEHYNSGVQNHPNLSNQLRVGNNQVRRLNLDQNEKDALVAFMRTLTDENFIRDPKFSNPFLEPL